MEGGTKLNYIETLQRKMTEKRFLKKLDDLLSDEKMKEYFRTHSFIDDKYLIDYLQEHSTMQIDEPTFEDMKRMYSVYFSIEYYKRKNKKEPEKATDFAMYYFFIYRNIENLCNIIV